MLKNLAVLLMIGSVFSGCAHRQLRKNYTRQVQTLNQMMYEQTLDNIAMFEVDRDSLPAFVTVGAGSTQVVNDGSGSISLGWGGPRPTQGLGIGGGAALSESWAASPVVNADNLRWLQCALKIVVCPPALSLEEFTKKIDTKDGEVSVMRWKISRSGACTDCVNELVSIGFLLQPEDETVDRGSFDFKQYESAEKYLADLTMDIHCKLPSGWYECRSTRLVSVGSAFNGNYGSNSVCVNECSTKYLSALTLSLTDLATRKPPAPKTVEVRRLFKIGDGELEFKGNLAGTMEDVEALAKSDLKQRLLSEAKRLQELFNSSNNPEDKARLEGIRKSLKALENEDSKFWLGPKSNFKSVDEPVQRRDSNSIFGAPGVPLLPFGNR